MTNTEIRIAVAGACGWEPSRVAFDMNGPMFYHQCWNKQERLLARYKLPDFTEDLNAMAQARATLTTDTERSKYFEALHQIVGPISDNPQWAMIDASARQHAEAFLKVKSLWRD